MGYLPNRTHDAWPRVSEGRRKKKGCRETRVSSSRHRCGVALPLVSATMTKRTENASFPPRTPGPIPDTFGNLTNLVEMDLAHNSLSGEHHRRVPGQPAASAEGGGSGCRTLRRGPLKARLTNSCDVLDDKTAAVHRSGIRARKTPASCVIGRRHALAARTQGGVIFYIPWFMPRRCKPFRVRCTANEA